VPVPVPPRHGGIAPCPGQIPMLAGVGLRPRHYADVLADPGQIAWVEVHPENYLCAGGPQHDYLTQVRERMAVSFHGVGLSLGGEERPDAAHLWRLRALAERYQPVLFSEHLAWSSHGGQYLNDLLPLPYTYETLARMIAHVGETQEALGRRILIENPSLYLAFEASEMPEAAFLAELAARSGCGLLLDLNNVYVSCMNAGTNPLAYLARFPREAVMEIHLAGHAPEFDRDGLPVLIDAHDRPVADPVWQLFARMVEHLPPVPVLIEWDSDLPEWPVLLAEARRAQSIVDLVQGRGGGREVA